MKIVHADQYMTVYQAACPACDLPLELVTSSRVGDIVTWHRGELAHDDCPRCGERLPTELPSILEPVAA